MPRRKIVIFISTGDTCRSPMAAGYMRKLLEDQGIDDIDVRSAGVLTVTGLKASQEARQIMEAHGVNLERHLSSQLTPDMIRRASLILGMTPYHVQRALRISEEARDKSVLLKEYAQSDPKNVQITDPMGGTLEVFKQRFKEIKHACEKLLETEFFAKKKKAPKAEAKPKAEAPAEKAKRKSTAKKKKAAAEPKPKKTKTAKPKKKAARAASQKTAAKKTAKKKTATKKKAAAKKKAPAKRKKAARAVKKSATTKKKSTTRRKAGGAKAARPGKTGRKTARRKR